MNEYHEAFCPVCGSLKGRIATERIESPYSKKYKYHRIETEDFWAKTVRDFQTNKPFGYIRDASGGYGSGLPILGELNSEDDPEMYENVKTALFNGISNWLQKGWIKKRELLHLISK